MTFWLNKLNKNKVIKEVLKPLIVIWKTVTGLTIVGLIIKIKICNKNKNQEMLKIYNI